MKSKLYASGAAFFSDLAGFRSRYALMVVSLMLARSVSEGITFILLVPLLAAAGVAPPIEREGQWLSWLQVPAVARETASLEFVLSLFFAAIALRTVLGYASSIASTAYLVSYTNQVRQRVYKAFSRSSWLHLASSRAAQDNYALTMQADNVHRAAAHSLGLAAAVMNMAAGVAVAIAVSPQLTATALLAVAVLAIPLTAFQRWAYERGEKSVRAIQRLYDVISTRMSGVKLAKAFAIEKELERDFAESSTAYAEAVVATQKNSARAWFVQELGAGLILVALIYVGLRVQNASSLELVVLIAIFSRLMPLAGSALAGIQALASLLPDYAALRALEKSATAAQEELPEEPTPIELKRDIEIRDVTFSYPSLDGNETLCEISVKLAARSAVGITGLSGAGKSTLADIIAGLIPPDRGSVLIDGIPLDGHNRPHWRASVAYVPQDAPLFHDTLRANLRIGARQASDAEILACLELVGAADLIRNMPEGLETLAGDRGVRLSGGERQRIRLASALLRRPQLLLLDESTSALSPADEAAIIGALDRLRDRMTLLIIAHRTTSISWTDRVLVVQDGRIQADGPPSAVLG